MIFYLLFILIAGSLLLLGYLLPEKNRIFQGVTFLLIVGVVGFRDFVGADFGDYVVWYKSKVRDQDFELGYVALMNFFRTLNIGYPALFFFISFFTYLFLFLGVKKFTQNQNLAIFIFLLIPSMFLLSLNTIRQSFAVSICFFAFYFLINKKYFYYFILMFLAMSLHSTAILPFFLFLLVYQFADKIKVSHILILLIGSLLFSQLGLVHYFSSFFKDSRYIAYFTTMKIPVNPFKLIILNGLTIFMLFYFEEMKKKYPYQKYLMILFFLSVIITNFFSLYGDLTRIAYYFKIFEILVIADFIFLRTKAFRVWLCSCFMIYYLSIFVYTLKMDLEKDYKYKLIPYKNILFESFKIN
jgi:hypothetical protein